MRRYDAEAVELVAVSLAADKPDVGFQLLEAVVLGRRGIGLGSRPS